MSGSGPDDIYIIGGGTCSGKTSVAKALCLRYGLAYYGQDDHLEEYMNRMAGEGNDLAGRVAAYTPAEMWLRPPAEQCAEEMRLYDGMMACTWQAVQELAAAAQRPVLAEGAGFLPWLVYREGVKPSHYLCLAPTRAFRLSQYAKREWISYILADTGDPEQAFANWMERDALLADEALAAAGRMGYSSLQIDGSRGLQHSLQFAQSVFQFKDDT